MKTNYLLLYIFIQILFTTNIRAIGGGLDTGFTNGITRRGVVQAVAVQADGKVLVGGTFLTMNGVTKNDIARLNADGTLDTSFDSGTGIGNGNLASIVVQPDGKILIGGNFAAYNSTVRNHIARLNSDGSVDTTFVTTGTGFNSLINDLALLPDGRIAVVGNFSAFNGTSRLRVAIVNSDGTLDTTFVPAPVATFAPDEIVVQADGKFIIGGNFHAGNGSTNNRIARLNADGTLDATYNVGTGFNFAVSGLALDASGKAVVGGSFSSFNGTTRNNLARLNTNGTLDNSFSGTFANNLVADIQISTGGEIYVGGNFTSFNGSSQSDYIVRLLSDGSTDTTFNPANPAIARFGGASLSRIALQTDGKVLIAGNFEMASGTPRLSVVRFNTDATVDGGFEIAPGQTNGSIDEIAVKTDGKIVIAGNFEAAGSNPRTNIAQLNADSTTDTTFNPVSGTNARVFAIAVQADGKIIIGGDFTTFNGTTRNRLVRINTDGTPDATFTIGTGASGTVRKIVLQTDGKILIVGNFTTYNGISRNRIARLNADGTLDTTFTVGTGANLETFAIAVQTDGKIIIGGAFTTYNGASAVRLTRLNTDGSLDTTFNPAGAGADGSIVALGVQTNGRIVIGGGFLNYNGTSRIRIARVNTDGTLDTTFNPGTGVSGVSATLETLTMQTDGKIIIGGNFTIYNGVSINRLARINTDGAFDTTFVPSSGAETFIYSTAVQTDGKILAGGSFTTFNGTTRYFLARVLPGENLIWNGSISTDWNTAANWTPAQVPTNVDAVLIPSAGVTNYPVLITTTLATCAALTVESGAVLTMASGAGMPIQGGLINNGLITGDGGIGLFGAVHINNGTIEAEVFFGGSLKTLNGTGRMGDVSVGNGTVVRLTSDHRFRNIFTNGVFDAQNFTVSLDGPGDVMFNAQNIACNGCTFILDGSTGPQRIQQIDNGNGYYNLIINHPSGVSLTTNSITVNNSLTLTRGNVSTGSFKLTVQENVTVTRTNGYVIGKLEKIFPANTLTEFTFETGTANGYSPVSFKATIGAGAARAVQIETFQTNQPNLPASISLARYWAITAGADIISANLIFNYLQTDVMGNEANYRIFRVSGGTPTGFPNNCGMGSPCVDAVTNTATINGVTQFSDWTLATFSPTAASVTVGGRVLTSNGRGVSKALVVLTAPNGETRYAVTNPFGYYRFAEVTVGESYVLAVRHKQHQFTPQILEIKEEIGGLDFIAEGGK